MIPDAVRSMSPLIVDSDDDEDSDDEDDEDDDDDDDEPSEGVPIEQYRAWLGESLGFLILSETLFFFFFIETKRAFLWAFHHFRYLWIPLSLVLCCTAVYLYGLIIRDKYK